MIYYYSLYRKEDGLFTGEVLGLPEPRVEHPGVPSGHAWHPGHHDHLSRKLDLTTNAVVDYRPSAPSEDHQWNANSRRWLSKVDAAEHEARRYRGPVPQGD
jgi:hypothetical protein